MIVRSGREEGIPYSLSRWTDVPAAKWAWMEQSIRDRKMIAFDPRNAIPYEWSLKPEDTLGLVFWTKYPDPLIKAAWLKDYHFHVHITVTGWHEVEHKAPDLKRGKIGLYVAARELGPENVTWRFSPVPLVPDVVERFDEIAEMASAAGLSRVFLSFLQTNDNIPETRSREDRLETLLRINERAEKRGVRILLCNEDSLLSKVDGLPANLGSGVCAPPEDFALPGMNRPPSEGCGCVLMADPFTINETCIYGCEFCYAADKSLAPKKRNTTKGLPIVP
jgi:hypothetical protein